jgi:murein DD-endopeptidase MepM/ murein hydrolase activator NlpD
MPSQNTPERRRNRRYTVVLVPEGETRKPLTVSFSLLGLSVVIGGTILVVMSIIIAAILYTPIGSRLPIHNAELEQRYGKQIVGIQEQLRSLVQEMVILRAYNMKLRHALGENISSQESTLTQAVLTDSVRRAIEANAKLREGRMEEETISKQDMSPPSGGVPTRADEETNLSQKIHRVEFPLLPPVEGYMTRGFETNEFHYGVDFAGKQGTAVLAAADGNVVFAGWTYDNGFMMIIGHEAGLMTIYKHNKALLKETGASVKRGEIIALLGNTGITSSGPHLHFEIWKDGVAQNPGNYLLNIQ